MNKDDLQRYFVAGSQDFPTLTLSEYEAKIVAMMQTGITAYQFREKGAGLTDSATRLALARRLQAAAKVANVRFLLMTMSILRWQLGRMVFTLAKMTVIFGR